MFTCNGTIVGYTMVALRNENPDPLIQVWRPEGSCYYRKIDQIASSKASQCVDSLNGTTRNRFLHCNLTTDSHVRVEYGDVLGLEVFERTLRFALVSHAPTNYIFDQVSLSSPVLLSNSSTMNQELPQITLDIISGNTLKQAYVHRFKNISC